MSRSRRASGFTLIELLAAMAVLALLMIVLAGASNQFGHAWTKGAADTRSRQRARAALELMGRELERASLPLDRTDQASLRFQVDPAAAASVLHGNAVFWQAPVATVEGAGEFAEVGYYVAWTGTSCALCRYFLNPTSTGYDPADPNASLPGLDDPNYLFLENVAGLWVRTFNADGTAYGGDSRASGTLPAWIEVALALLDATSAKRLSAAPTYAAISPGQTAAQAAQAFLDALPSAVRAGSVVVSLKVPFAAGRSAP